MKVCLISKYPPIEGGESSKAYWLAKGLGKKGHEVHVVTNAWEVEEKYREQMRGFDLDQNYQPQNVYVHNTDPFIEPAYIPYSKPYTEKIASLAIDIIREFDLQIIDSWYILPYVVSGFIAKTITDKPQIMRHAGSDMSRLLNSPFLRVLFISLFNKVDKIITCPAIKETFESFGIQKKKLFYNFNVSVDTDAFNPTVEPANLSEYAREVIDDDIPVVTYIGKLNRVKGVYELAEAVSEIKEDFLLLFVTQSSGLESFQEFIENKRLKKRSLFLNFVPPWRMPSIIKRSSCVVVPERDFPVVQHTPILPREVLATGGCLILSKELYDKMKRLGFSDKENLLVVDPKNISEFKAKLEVIIKKPDCIKNIKKGAHQLSERIEHFENYVDDMIQLYGEVLDNQQNNSL